MQYLRKGGPHSAGSRRTRETAAAEREALRDTQHAAQLAELRGSPPASGHPGSFTPNKGFNDIKPFSCTRARELCLKLAGDALLAYNQWSPPDSSPAFEEVAAQHFARRTSSSVSRVLPSRRSKPKTILPSRLAAEASAGPLQGAQHRDG